MSVNGQPLYETFQQIAAGNPYLQPQFGEQVGQGWIGPQALFAENSPLLAGLIAAAQARYHTPPPNVLGSVVLQDYAWRLIAAVIAAYLCDQRVPDLGLGNVQVRVSAQGNVEGVAFASGRFAALPSDPAAAHPDAALLPDQAALQGHLRGALEAHLDWVIARLCATVGCRPVGLWLAAADRCAGTFSWLMEEQGTPATLGAIRTEVNALVHAPGSPLASRKTGVGELTHEQQRYIFLDRATCCYWYKTDGGDYCSTCPRLPQAERRERLRRYVTEQHAQVADEDSAA